MVKGEVVPGVGSALVNITVTDANDHAPLFTATSYQFEISENVTIGTSVGRVDANDTDGSNSEVGVAYCSLSGCGLQVIHCSCH